MDTDERTTAGGTSTVYDGFISYSHGADDLLAPRLQQALQRFAKPWWKRRALRIFRDESSLSANPHLWSSIVDALDDSEWFVLLLSPEAAQSEWVNQEIEYWKAKKDPSRILPALTDGTFNWDGSDIAGTAAPETLSHVFSEEPRWVDLRFARDGDQLDLKDPRFADAVADIASALRGVPKDELASEEVIQHRRTIRTAWGGATLVALLAVAATVFGFQASSERDRAQNLAEAEAEARQEAESQRRAAESSAQAESDARADAERNAQLAAARALAASAIAALEDDPELSTLLAVQAIRETPEGIEQPFEVINALWRAGSSNRLVNTLPSSAESFIALSGDGTRLAISEGHRIRLVAIDTGEDIWSYDEETVDLFHHVDIGPDGIVAVAVLDSEGLTRRTHRREFGEVDDIPNRILILDGDTGSVIQRLEYPACSDVQSPTWSPDGRYLVVSSGLPNAPGGNGEVKCSREGANHWLEVYDTESWEPVAMLPVLGEPRPVWDGAGFLHALSGRFAAVSFDPGTFEPRASSTVSGIGDVTPDGSTFVVAYPTFASDMRVHLFGVDIGVSNDILYHGSDFPWGIDIVDNGTLAVIGTHGSHTFVYDLSTSEQLQRLATGAVSSTAFDPTTRRLYTAGADAGVKVWDLRVSTVGVDTVADLGRFSWVNGNSFVVGPEAVAMNTVDIPGSQAALAVGLPPVMQFELFSPDSGMVTAAFPDGFSIQALANGKWVVTTLLEEIFLWDPVPDERVTLLECEVAESDGTGVFCVGEGEPLGWLALASADGQHILAYGFEDRSASVYSGHFRLFDAETGEELARVEPGQPRSPDDPMAMLDAVLPDHLSNDFAFGSTESGTSVAYDLETGHALYRVETIYGFELSPDDDLIAINDAPASVTVIDTSLWLPVFQLGTGSRIRGMAFNADGSRLAIGGDTLLIIETASGRILQQMALAGVSDMHWIDDETLIVGTNTGIFGTVSLSTDDFLAKVRDGLQRTFTESECRVYAIDACPSLEQMKEG